MLKITPIFDLKMVGIFELKKIKIIYIYIFFNSPFFAIKEKWYKRFSISKFSKTQSKLRIINIFKYVDISYKYLASQYGYYKFTLLRNIF